MIVELTNHWIEMSGQYEIEGVEEHNGYFRFYFGKGKWSKEYHMPTYTYRIIQK